MPLNLPTIPPSLKRIAHYIKIAQEHDSRDVIVSYWSCLYALQTGLKLSTKLPEENALLLGIMEWLENTKKENSSNESITNEIVAQAYLENYALKLFTYANQQDLASNFGKNVVKSFYTAGMIYDVLLTFGELSVEAQKNSKYAKWKATYIHNCLKNGETPIPGSTFADDELEGGEEGASGGQENNSEFNEQPSMPEQKPSTPNSPENKPAAAGNSNENYGFFEENIGNKLPTPPSFPEKDTSGFQAYVPTEPAIDYSLQQQNDVVITPDQMIKAQKYCKWAGSALNYDDVKASIDNLQKALRLLQTGRDE